MAVLAGGFIYWTSALLIGIAIAFWPARVASGQPERLGACPGRRRAAGEGR
jgi:hypothetical protein